MEEPIVCSGERYALPAGGRAHADRTEEFPLTARPYPRAIIVFVKEWIRAARERRAG